jgi:hypothetical protein
MKICIRSSSIFGAAIMALAGFATDAIAKPTVTGCGPNGTDPWALTCICNNGQPHVSMCQSTIDKHNKKLRPPDTNSQICSSMNHTTVGNSLSSYSNVQNCRPRKDK